MSDLIDRQAAIDAVNMYYDEFHEGDPASVEDVLKALPSAQPEITLESAIDYLHSIGWMQEHDRIMSASVQPEIIKCKDCRYSVDYYHEGDCYCSNPKWGLTYFGGSWEFYCADAKRRTDENNN